MVELVLFHSPIVGPGFWRPTARVLEQRGFRCTLASAPTPAAWCNWPAAACTGVAVTPGCVVIGHSAAGYLLPAVARALNARTLLFVDALIPPRSGSVAPADEAFLQFVRQLPRDELGRLPPWSRWWGEGAIERLIGDPGVYARFEAELPRLRPSWFEDALEVPDWSARSAAYLQTSERFATTAQDAARGGWQVETLAGTHLHPFLAPDETATAIHALLSRVGVG